MTDKEKFNTCIYAEYRYSEYKGKTSRPRPGCKAQKDFTCYHDCATCKSYERDDYHPHYPYK